MSSKEHKQKIWSFIEEIGVGMLVTQDEEDLRARPMSLVQDQYDGTLWFFTRKNSEKISETQDQHRVCLTFNNHDQGIHVSLSGWAHRTQAPELIDRFWSDGVAAWYPEGRQDPEVALLEVKIYQGEHWEANQNKPKQIFEYAKANLTDSVPDLGENEKFGG